MNDGRYPYTTLEMELLAIAGNDYESLETIRKCHWNDDVPLPTVDEMVRSLRGLQSKGWVQCYRFAGHPQGFIAIDDFRDEEARDPIQLTGKATLWWLATESGSSELDKRPLLGNQGDEVEPKP